MTITKTDELAGDNDEPVSTKIAVTNFNTARFPVSSENINKMVATRIDFFDSRVTRMRWKMIQIGIGHSSVIGS